MGPLRFLRDLARRFGRRTKDSEADEEEAPDSDSGVVNRLQSVLRPIRDSLPDPDVVAEKSEEHLGTAKQLATSGIDSSAGAAREFARRASKTIRSTWSPEDPEEILEESPLFRPLPEEPREIPPELLSLRWRSEAVLALSAAGLLSLEDEIIRHTDRLFHAGLPTPQLSERIFGRDFSELHQWIDTVPGRTAPGGGIIHRLKHGHDLEAAAAIYREHGLEGVLAWTQHVGQDVFSITGIPIPVGGQTVADFLVDRGTTSPGKAALLVSFNAVELAASFLAGAFALRLARLLREMKSRRRVKRRCAAAFAARERGDSDAMIANYAEARSLSDDPALSLALGWAYREIGRPTAESFLEFRRAALGLGSQDQLINLDGVSVSLRGLAYLLALAEAPQVLQREDLRGAWREELDRMARGAARSFEAVAIAQSERPSITLGERRLEWRPLPLSAAANYYLAARGMASVPFASSTVEIPRLRDRAVEMLRRAKDGAVPNEADRLMSVAKRWRGELAVDVGLRPGS